MSLAGPFDAAEADDPILEGLNPDQREAVLHHAGPLLVIAGAGSGKTRVLTHRIAHLIRSHGVSPFEILAITFTNKAADEMKARVGALVGPVAEKMWVSTFHSACVRILRRDAKRLGYPSSFTIYDQADAVRLTGYVIRDLHLDPKRFPPRAVHATISAVKNDAVSVAEYADRAKVIFERKIADVYARVPAPPPRRRRHGLRRPPPGDRRAVPDPARRAGALPAAVQARPRRRVPGHQPRPERARPPPRGGAPQHLRRRRQRPVPAARHAGVDAGGTRCPSSRSTWATWSSGTLGGAATAPAKVTFVKDGPFDRSAVRGACRSRRGWPERRTTSCWLGTRSRRRQIPRLPDAPERPRLADRTHEERPAAAGRRVDTGLRVRLNQEHADAAWILCVCDSRSEAAFWEAWFAAQYGLPTALFHGLGRNLAMGDDQLRRLFDDARHATARAKAADGRPRPASRLPAPPHPGRGTATNAEPHDVQRPPRRDVAYHRVQWSSNRRDVADRLARAGLLGPRRASGRMAIRDQPNATTSRLPRSHGRPPMPGASRSRGGR